MLKLVKRGKTYYAVGMVNRKRFNRSLHETDARKAAARMSRLESSIREGAAVAPTVAEWWETYQESHLRTLAPRVQTLYRHTLKSVRERWSNKRLTSLNPSDILAWQQDLLKTKAPNTVRTAQGIVSSFFGAAMKDGLIRTNPCNRVRKPRGTVRSRVLTIDEQRKLFLQLAPKYQVAVKILLGTGLREAELLSITPESIQEDGLHIVGKGAKARIVPLQKEVRDLLPSLERMSAKELWGQVTRAAERAKIAPLTIHDMRRTFATRCAIAGMPPIVLARILGHWSSKTTDQYYLHLQTADATAAINRVNLGIGGKWGKVLQMKGKK